MHVLRSARRAAGRRALARLTLAVATIACGGDGGSTAVKASVATVSVTPATASVLVGASTTFSAGAKDAAGNTVSGRPVTWSAQNAAIATVTSQGTVTAVAPGTTLITATIDGMTGSASLTVAARTLTSVSLTPRPMLVAVGGTASLHAEALDQQNNAFANQTFSYQSSANGIATVDANGIVSGVAPGQATLSATTAGVTASSPLIVLAPTTVAGRVLTTDGGTGESLQFTLQTGAGVSLQSFVAPLDAAGSFRLNAPLTLVATDSVSLIIDGGASRVYRPVFVRAPTTRATTLAAKPLLVPRRVTFGTPVYPTSSIPVSLQSAFTRVCTDDSNANCNSYFPQIWKNVVILWADADLPIPLAFNRTTGPISAADSVALWTVIDQMNKELGRQLFVPADFSEVVAPDASGFSRKAVLVSIDATLSGFSGYTNWIWDSGFNMLAAKTRVRLNTFLADRSLMTHELLHALGFHHTCAWSTVMGGYGCPSAAGATQSDAAGFALAYQIRRAVLATPATTTLGDALRGEQVLELGFSASRAGTSGPIAFAPLSAHQIIFGGRLVSVDGAP